MSCHVSLYADDTLLYQIDRSSNDATVFQENIDAVYKWSIEWRMPINKKKFQAINLGKPNPLIPAYTLGSTTPDLLRASNTFV